MKIIKKGKLKTKKFSCKHCGCIFECNEKEYNYCHELDNMKDGNYEAICPTCGRPVKNCKH